MIAGLFGLILERHKSRTGDAASAERSPTVSLTTRGVPTSVSMPACPRTAPMPSGAKLQNQPVATDAATACGAFLGYLRHEFGEGEMLWRYVFQCYCSLARDRGWPILSEKALSQGLSALGCTSRQRDLRGEGKGRPRELIWPGLAATGSEKVAA